MGALQHREASDSDWASSPPAGLPGLNGSCAPPSLVPRRQRGSAAPLHGGARGSPAAEKTALHPAATNARPPYQTVGSAPRHKHRPLRPH
jgi:hypothetical protein